LSPPDCAMGKLRWRDHWSSAPANGRCPLPTQSSPALSRCACSRRFRSYALPRFFAPLCQRHRCRRRRTLRCPDSLDRDEAPIRSPHRSPSAEATGRTRNRDVVRAQSALRTPSRGDRGAEYIGCASFASAESVASHSQALKHRIAGSFNLLPVTVPAVAADAKRAARTRFARLRERGEPAEGLDPMRTPQLRARNPPSKKALTRDSLRSELRYSCRRWSRYHP